MAIVRYHRTFFLAGEAGCSSSVDHPAASVLQLGPFPGDGDDDDSLSGEVVSNIAATTAAEIAVDYFLKKLSTEDTSLRYQLYHLNFSSIGSSIVYAIFVELILWYLFHCL